MSTNTKIEWTDRVWNPTTGCTRVSSGCDFCYAVRTTHRFAMMKPKVYGGLTVLNNKGERHFNGTVRCLPERLPDPLHWRKPCRVFVNSMSDLFHKDVPFEFIDKVFAVMALCPQHVFQILTKRPERMEEYLLWIDPRMTVGDTDRVDRVARAARQRYGESMIFLPLSNVWLGTSIEDQATADERIPHLLRCPAAVRFLSVEPMLGPIENITRWIELAKNIHGDGPFAYIHAPPGVYCAESNPRGALSVRAQPEGLLGVKPSEFRRIDWVICGGESGPGARPVHPEWVRSIRDQCHAPGVPFFFKQWGEFAPQENLRSVYGSTKMVDGMYRIGKKAAGAMLDGREWREYPETAATKRDPSLRSGPP